MQKTDTQIKHDIEKELEWDPAVNAAGIGIQVHEGIVTVTGHLPNYAEKFAVERLLKRISGVRAFAIELDVKLPMDSKRTDAEIAEAAQHALQWNNSVPSDQLKVMVEKGHVILSGQVDWGYQRTIAENTLRYLTGVTRVTNQISVKHRLAVTPIDIEKNINAALHRQAESTAKRVSVSYVDGEATLQGTVHSWAERQAVRDAVWAAPGVTSIIDQIHVDYH